MKKLYFFFLMGFMLINSNLYAQNTWYVNDDSLAGDVYTTAVGNDGTNLVNDPSRPSLTLADAIASAANGDTIYVDTGTYSDDSLVINKQITIIGAGTGNSIFDGTGRPVNFGAITVSNVVIKNIKLTRYFLNSSSLGQAINISGNISGILLENLLITDNKGGTNSLPNINISGGSNVIIRSSFFKCSGYNGTSGGGIKVTNSTLLVETSLFFNNEDSLGGSMGGAIWVNGASSNVTVTDCPFIGNIGRSGGAIGQDGGTLTVTGSCFSDNISESDTSTDGGGAIYVTGTATTSISNCTFSNNRATNGGGASASADGGAIKFNQVTGTASITLCSFLNNGTDLTGTIIGFDDGQDIAYRGTSLNITISNNNFSQSSPGEVNIYEISSEGNEIMSNNGVYTHEFSTGQTYTALSPTRTAVAGYGTWTDIFVTGSTVPTFIGNLLTPIRTQQNGYATWTDTSILGTTAWVTMVGASTVRTSFVTGLTMATSGGWTQSGPALTGGTSNIIMRNSNNAFISPTLDFSISGMEYLIFYARTSGGIDALKNLINVSISSDGGSSWTLLGSRTPLSATSSVMDRFDLSAYSGNNIKIKFETPNADGAIGADLDNINIYTVGTVSSTITPTLDLSGTNAKTLSFSVLGSNSTGSSVVYPGANDVLVSVSTDNGANYSILETITPTGTATVRTIDLSSYTSSTVKVKLETPYASPSDAVGTGNQTGATLDDITLVNVSTTITPTLDFSGKAIQLKFTQALVGSNTTRNSVLVSISIDNGATWSQVSNTNTSGLKVLNLTSYQSANTKVKFETLYANATIGASIDDFIIESTTIASGLPVTNCIATSNITVCGAPAVICDTETKSPVIIKCVDNKIITNCSGNLPNYTSEVSAYDDCFYTITQSPAPGTSLASLGNGPHTITITVSDQSPNSPDATCTFTITLSGCTITCSDTTTWNGTWSNGAPTETKSAIFTTNYTADADVFACSVTISDNAVVTIPSGFDCTVSRDITVNTGSSFVFENTANLLQLNATATNTGNIRMTRNTNPLIRLDYTLWSAPVTGQNLLAFSPLTLANRFYTYNTNTNFYITVPPDATSFTPGRGYQIRTPNNHPTTATVWSGTFEGVPNNGGYTTPLANFGDGKRFNMVGNPYPSPLNLTAFVTANGNNITGTLWFWRKTNSIATDNVWSTWNGETFTGTLEDFGNINPNNLARNGQGFFVEAKDASTALVFNNSMRRANNTNQFFRSAQTNSTENTNTVVPNAKHRIWLNLTDNTGLWYQQAISYIAGGTAQVDQFDGKSISTGNMLFNSIIPNSTDYYVIQSRPVPFDTEDSIALNLKITNPGTYSISVSNKDGLFADGTQPIFLTDNFSTTCVNLNEGAYSFTAEAGTFDNRFELRYTNNLLGIPDNTLTPNSVMVYQNNTNQLIVSSSKNVLEKIAIYDTTGRLLFSQDSINNNEFSTTLDSFANVLLLVQITDSSGLVITKKIIKQ